MLLAVEVDHTVSPAHECHCLGGGAADGWSSSAPTQFLVSFFFPAALVLWWHLCVHLCLARCRSVFTLVLLFWCCCLFFRISIFLFVVVVVRLVASPQWFSACAFFLYVRVCVCVPLFVGVRRLIVLLLWRSVTAVSLPA